VRTDASPAWFQAPARTSAAAASSRQTPRAPVPASVQTSNGWTYRFHPDGTTTRAVPSEPGRRPSLLDGVRSQFTFFVAPGAAKTLGSLLRSPSGGRKALVALPQGRIGLRFAEGPHKGKLVKGSVFPVAWDPRVGLAPVEAFASGNVVRVGTPVVTLGSHVGSQGRDRARGLGQSSNGEAWRPNTFQPLVDRHTSRANGSEVGTAHQLVVAVESQTSYGRIEGRRIPGYFAEGELTWKDLPRVPTPYKVNPNIDLVGFMAKIRKEPFEVIAAFNNAGKLVTQPVRGSESTVGFPPEVYHLVENAHVVHNHPRSGPPSTQDYKAMLFYNVSAMTIVWRKGSMTMIRPADGWPPIAIIKSADVAAFNRARERYKETQPEPVGEARFLLMSDLIRQELVGSLGDLGIEVVVK